MARVNITTKPGQVANQQQEMDLSTLLDTPSETIESNILQPSDAPIQGVTADAPQAIEGAPVSDPVADQQAIEAGLLGQLDEEQKILSVEEEVDRQNELYGDITNRILSGKWQLGNHPSY